MSDITLEINGIAYSGFMNASASMTMEDVSGTFSFTISALSNLQKFPVKNGSECRVLVNKEPVITGFIEQIGISYKPIDHVITITGRDKTCDAIDSTLGSGISFTTSISLIDIAKTVLSHMNINDIDVYSNVDLEIFKKTEINNIVSQFGETAFDFIEKYAKKRQVLMMADGMGGILFAQASDQQINTIFNLSTSSPPTVLEANVKYDNTKRFYKYILSSQSNMLTNIVNDLDTIDNNKSVNVVSIALDEGIRTSRTYNMLQGEVSYNDTKDLQNRAIYEANFRRSRSFTYNVTVQGFSPLNDPNIIWKPNLLVKVIDEFSDINSLLLVKSVKYNYSIEEGSTTDLELIDKDSYTVDVLQGIKYKKNKEIHQQGNNIVNDLTQYQKNK